jgi:peptide/nickel transport system ATP-binding protein
MRLLPDGVVNKSGAAQMEKVSLFELPEREMRRVRGGKMAMIFQEPGLSLNPVMTVGQQIAEVLELHAGGRGATNLPSPQPSPLKGEGVAARCIELLDQVGIPDAARRINEYPFQLSGGMKQRVMIAMALAGSPRLLIADEPTTALDVTIQAQVLQLLRDTQAKTGMAMLLITHDLGVVAETAHRVGVMYAGQIVEQASRDALFAKPLHPYTQKLFAALPSAGRVGQPLSAIPGSVPALGSITQGCRFAPRCDKAWTLCREKTPAWTEVAVGQGVRCHLYAEGMESEKGQSMRRGKGEGERVEQQEGAPSSFSLLPSLLQVENLQVHFPIRKGLLQRVVGSVKAVDGVSLSITQGRTLALVGESGCGKTTLGKSLLQLVPSTGGSVQFAGRELIGSHASRAAMQMVFQDPYASLNPKMRVAEILEEGMVALNKSLPLQMGGSSETRQAYIDTLLDKVGLARDSKWRYPHEFSGGQRQRIAIARALAVSPQLLICDEPTSALDVSVQAQILNLLKSLQDELGLSYLFITHNLGVVEYLAHEVCVMYLGRVVERGATAEVMHAPKHPYTQALLSAVPRIDGEGRVFIKLEGELPSPAHPPSGCHFAQRCTHVMPSCAAYPDETSISATHHVRCHLYSPS